MDLIQKILSPPPTAPDGLSDLDARGGTVSPNTSKLAVVTEILYHGLTCPRRFTDAGTMIQAGKTILSGAPMNDRELLLEKGVSFLQHLKPGSGTGEFVADKLIAGLWRDLPHPPVTYVGNEHRYRKADGSNNNIFVPGMGKAGSFYARNVPSTTPKLTNLPDPEVVFDALLKRDRFVEHPSGLSSMFFAFATVVIHEIFQTNRQDENVNDTSSYVDLSTLYGNNDEEVDKVRRRDGSGRIWPDVVGSDRIMLMPPKVQVILVLFSRNHNYITERLLKINECGWYNQDYENLNDEDKKKQDEDLFQIARNVNAATFATVVLTDYVNAILNTNRSENNWSLALHKEIKEGMNRVERGTGGAISVEFNTLYRWHASMSETDAKWTHHAFAYTFNKNPEEITPEEFLEVGRKREAAFKATSPKEWKIHGIERDENGRFRDEDLAKIITNAVNEPAGAFKARGTPAAFKIVEVMGMRQARMYGVCSLNEFRKYLNLKPFESFEEWNSNKEIAAAAEKLYLHIDNLELYPGLLAEEPKPAMEGSGVCVGHTIGRGILDDAVALVRSDRFLTYDLTPYTLTSWGMQQLTPHSGAHGGLLPRVLYNALPFSFPYNSTYALFPFYTPKTIQEILKKHGKLEKYNVEFPRAMPTLHGINTFEGCKTAFGDRGRFEVIYLPNLKAVTNNRGFMIGWDDERHDTAKRHMLEHLIPPAHEPVMREYFRNQTIKMIEKNSVSINNGRKFMLDVVRDVCNTVPVHYIAERWGIPIKSAETPYGLFTIQELHMALVVLFVFTSFDIIPATGWDLREASLKVAPAVLTILKSHLNKFGRMADKAINTAHKVVGYFYTHKQTYGLGSMAEEFYNGLLSTGMAIDDLAASALGMCIPIAGNITQQTALIIDFYLRPENDKHKKKIIQLALESSKEADAHLMGYIREAMRFVPVVVGLTRRAKQDTILEDKKISQGDLLLLSTSNAHMDPSVYPDFDKIDPKRKQANILMGHGMHYCLGARLVELPILEIMKPIFRLKNLRRHPGPAGELARYPKDLAGSHFHFCLTPTSKEVPMPMSMSIEYDA